MSRGVVVEFVRSRSRSNVWAQPVAFLLPLLFPSLSLFLFHQHTPSLSLSLLLKSLCTLIHKPCLCHVIQHFKYTAHFLPATECPKAGKTGSKNLRFQLAEPPPPPPTPPPPLTPTPLFLCLKVCVSLFTFTPSTAYCQSTLFLLDFNCVAICFEFLNLFILSSPSKDRPKPTHVRARERRVCVRTAALVKQWLTHRHTQTHTRRRGLHTFGDIGVSFWHLLHVYNALTLGLRPANVGVRGPRANRGLLSGLLWLNVPDGIEINPSIPVTQGDGNNSLKPSNAILVVPILRFPFNMSI